MKEHDGGQNWDSFVVLAVLAFGLAPSISSSVLLVDDKSTIRRKQPPALRNTLAATQERTKRPTNFVSDVIVEREKRETFPASLSNATALGPAQSLSLRRNFLAHDDPHRRSINRALLSHPAAEIGLVAKTLWKDSQKLIAQDGYRARLMSGRRQRHQETAAVSEAVVVVAVVVVVIVVFLL
jgi:hypothetical protein